jgi:hypothetical protein
LCKEHGGLPSRITAAYQGHFRLGAYLSRARLQIVLRIIARFLIKQAGLNAPKLPHHRGRAGFPHLHAPTAAEDDLQGATAMGALLDVDLEHSFDLSP